MKKLLFVFHAKAGHGLIRDHLMEIVSRFNQAGYAVTVMTTQYCGHATELIRDNAADYDLVLFSGGDGTVNEVVNGVLQLGKKIPLGYFPAGTTNDYASSLGIPKEVGKGIDRIISGDTFTSDVGMLNGRAFVYVAAFGTPVKVTYTTPQEEKNIWGYPAYIAELLKLLPNTKPYHLRIKNHGEITEGDFMLGFVTNSYTVSGFKGITGKDVSLNDGLFEVLLIKNVKNAAEMVVPFTSLLAGVPDERYIERFTTDDLIIESDSELDWNMDGEFGGSYTSAHISVVRNAVTFFV